MITLKDAKKLNPELNPELFFPSPKDVLKAIEKNKIVKDWLNFISEEHRAKPAKILLFVPCTPKKPYCPPRDEFHKRLLELEKRYDVYLVSVSEPLALEPREYWNFKWKKGEETINLIYDAPFFPWIAKYGYEWDEKLAEKVWSKLSKVAEKWYKRNQIFDEVICLAFPKTGYRKIVERIVDVFIPEYEPEKREEDYFTNTDKDYLDERVWKELINCLNLMQHLG